MKIAISGLGRMGMQIARKLLEGGHTVVAHDINAGPVDELKTMGAIAAYTKEDVATAFADEQAVIWLMLPANIVESELNDWLAHLPKQTMYIDGGNSDFRDTKRHAARVAEQGSLLVDVGTSGGVWGYQNGFSMMVGGDQTAYEQLRPILDTLALPEGAHNHFGDSGAGHYIKMVHNAIEYGVMESLAEGYRLLKEGPYQNIDLANVGDIWQHHSVVTSWLNELTCNALKENPNLDGINGDVAESGEARWALEVAKERGIDTPAIQASLDVRLASQQGKINFATKLLAVMRNAFGGHKVSNE
jgi:6-phosphogluconate dehydrogenase